MSTHQQKYRNRYLCYVIFLTFFIMFLTTTLHAADLSGDRSRTINFELRLASHEPIKGWESVPSDIPSIPIWISPEASLTNADVAQAWPDWIDDKICVMILFTEDGALKFARTTKAPIGGFMAIMFNGRVIAAPQIMAQITSGRAVVSGNFTEEEAKAFAEGINVQIDKSKQESNKGNNQSVYEAAGKKELMQKEAAVSEINAGLIQAAKDGSLADVSAALASGADINMKDERGLTPLIIGAALGQTEIVKLLLEKGADVNARDNRIGAMAIMVASDKGHVDIIKLLIENGADINAKDNNSSTPLMIAAEKGQVKAAKFLIENGADINAGNNLLGAMPIGIASDKGHVDIIKLLIENGADIGAKDKNGATPLMIAAEKDQPEVINFFIENGADINVRDNYGGTPLMAASYYGHMDIVRLLIEKGADVNAKDKNGGTTLMVASYYGRTDIIKLLIEKGADVNAKRNDGTTAIEIAKTMGQSGIAEMLKGAGAKE